MHQKLATLPLQVASKGLGLAFRAARIPLELARELIPGANGPQAEQAVPWTPPQERPAPAAAAPAPAAPAAAPPRRPRPRRRPAAAPPVPPEPVHVDEGVELVAEVAEPGAENGAGPEITVAEPWEGYARMRADEIVRRLASATPEEAAAVNLYEATHRNRRSVLDAAERRLKTV